MKIEKFRVFNPENGLMTCDYKEERVYFYLDENKQYLCSNYKWLN